MSFIAKLMQLNPPDRHVTHGVSLEQFGTQDRGFYGSYPTHSVVEEIIVISSGAQVQLHSNFLTHA